MSRITKRLIAIILLLMFAAAGWTGAQADGDNTLPEITNYAGLSGKTVSMLTGAPFEDLIREKAPDVGAFTSFNNMPDMLLALKSRKTDAVLINNAIAALTVNRDPEVALFPQNLQDGAFGFAFAKGDPKRNEWQEAFDAIPKAQMQAAWDKWTGADESVKVLPEQDWPGENGTVRVAACDTLEPMSYAGEGGTPVGFDLEVIQMIAKTLDVHVEFTGMEFSAILSSVQAGKADIGAGSIIITAERSESVDFVDYYPAAFVLIVRGTQTEREAQSTITSISQLNDPNIKLGLPISSAADEGVREQLPLAQLVHYNDNLLGFMDVAQGRIDAYVYDEVQLKISMENGVTGVRMLDECLDRQLKICVGISPVSQIPDLENKVNRFIAELKSEGVIDDMIRRWVWDAERTLPEIELPAEPQYHLTVGTSGIVMPYSYYEGGALTGFDIEMAYRFAQWLGADLEFQVYDYGAIVPAAVSGKVDVVMANLQYTDERAESGLIYSDEIYPGRNGVLVRDNTQHSEPTYEGGSVMTVLKGQKQAVIEETEDATFRSGIKSSFEKTFLREERWKLFTDGVLTTLLITLSAILFGTALGFLIYMLCRNGNPAANLITRFCLWLVQGMPMVVLLMILYYIIFGSVAISGIIVAVIGFALTFGAAVFGLLKMGVGAVDNGQYEAAYALGYSNRRTFFKIILPQALPHVMPAYKGEIVGLIKATAIVGYIAVQDLTKMGDIVRSRTYEAFFPLIAVTVIYFVLEGLIGFLVSRISLNFNPKRRKPADILKGVKTIDQDAVMLRNRGIP